MKKIYIEDENIDSMITQFKNMIARWGEEGVDRNINLSMGAFLKVEDDTPKIKVMFSPLAYAKMLNYVRQSSLEIAWHGCVERRDDDFYVKDVFCYPQKVTGTTVETDDEPYSQWVDSLDTDTYNTMRMQGHSHVNMSVTPSGTDWNYYKQQLRDTATDDFYIFLIMNKRHEVWCNVYDKQRNIHFEDADVIFEVVDDNFEDIIDSIKNDISVCCQTPQQKIIQYNKDELKNIRNTTDNFWEDEEYDYDDYYALWGDYLDECVVGNSKASTSYKEYRKNKNKKGGVK